MCPTTTFYLSLIVLSLLFGVYWFSRQYKNVKENFDAIAKLLDSPKIVSYFFNFIIKIEGYYKGRKAGWIFKAYQDNQRCTWLYVEPNCNIKRRYICIIDPKPTENTVLRGQKIYFIRGMFQDTIIGGLMRDNMPQFSVEDIKCMLDELSGAAEKVEAQNQNSLSIPIKEQLVNLITIIAAIIFMFFFIKAVISETLSKIH